MARTEFVKGVKCKRCGDFFTSNHIDGHTLCQNCGAPILIRDKHGDVVDFDKYGETAIIKVTYKFFGIIHQCELMN